MLSFRHRSQGLKVVVTVLLTWKIINRRNDYNRQIYRTFFIDESIFSTKLFQHHLQRGNRKTTFIRMIKSSYYNKILMSVSSGFFATGSMSYSTHLQSRYLHMNVVSLQKLSAEEIVIIACSSKTWLLDKKKKHIPTPYQYFITQNITITSHCLNSLSCILKYV